MINKEYFIRQGYQWLQDYSYNRVWHSAVFRRGDICLILDDGFDIENDPQQCFDYSKYCQMQNQYCAAYLLLLRFNVCDNEAQIAAEIEALLNENREEMLNDQGGIFADSHIDNTPTEAIFEEVFSEAYGNVALEFLRKEVAISGGDHHNYFIDYVVETTSGRFAFEENGVRYHHPLIVGQKRYGELLKKQNTMALLGYKVYRFSTDNLHFKDQIIQQLKTYLPEKSEFIPKAMLRNNRGVELYPHQSDILAKLDRDRLQGKTTALIVIPTASGKSEICISDLEKDYVQREVKRVLIMVPSLAVKQDWLKRIEPIACFYQTIEVQFYNTVFMHKNEYPQDYFDYIIFDEAHHSQAANCKATIQYFKPKYFIGLTATDERLDQKKLQEIFGSYEVKMTLREAIERGVVSDIRAYRLESSLDLREIRYNGKDYNTADLQRTLIIDSRNELIARVLKKYFDPQLGAFKQGIVFCVNQRHARKMAETLRQEGFTAAAVYGGNRNNDACFEAYRQRQLQFLCCCQIISEGWDSPQTEIIVMARPTLSKVLYLQQIGRGLRKHPGKECLYLIDVVDNYSARLAPWNFNSLFNLSTYTPWLGVQGQGSEYLQIHGLYETEMALRPVNVFTFEEKYRDYLSLEQAARELYIGTQTLNRWNREKRYASLYLPIGNTSAPYFSQADLERIRSERNLSVHTDETILSDFVDFIDENTLTFSFKLIFMISCLTLADPEGMIDLDELTQMYSGFYQRRLANGLPVDKRSCVYNGDNLKDPSFVKRSILSNPFEKFERKRFFYHSRDLNRIVFNATLWAKLNDEEKRDIMNKERKFLQEYYQKYGGLVDDDQF